MLTSCLLATVVLAAPPNAMPAEIRLTHCLISLIDEAQVPAKEAGELMEVRVKEGDAVRKDQIMAKIDDVDAQEQLNVANFEHRQAKEEAQSEIYVKYAKAACDVSEADLQSFLESNRRQPNTFPAIQVREKELIYTKSKLEIEKVKMDRTILGLKADVAAAKVGLAKENVARRVIDSPIDGMVVEIGRNVGEWVQAGEAIIHVERLDRVRVEGFVPSNDANPSEVTNTKVVVTVKLARGLTATFDGQIVNVNPTEEAGNNYRVWAEVQNRQQNGQWLLRPGLEAEMTIKLR